MGLDYGRSVLPKRTAVAGAGAWTEFVDTSFGNTPPYFNSLFFWTHDADRVVENYYFGG